MLRFFIFTLALILGAANVFGDSHRPSPNRTDEDSGIAWGPENESGIRLGVSLENPKEQYFAGELVRPVFHFRNDTQETIDFSHPTIVQAVWAKYEVLDQDSRDVDVDVLQELAWIAGAVGGQLESGEIGTVYGMMIRLGGSDCNDESGQFQTVFQSEPGQRLEVTFQLDAFIAAIASAKTGTLSLTIVEPIERANQLIKELGEWTGDQPFRSRPYMEMASILWSLDSEKRVALMKKWCADYDHQMIILCRMLFQAPEGKSIRRPKLGGPLFYEGEMKDWPLEPIVMVDQVPFLVTQGYVIGGLPESARVYLSYCLGKNYAWTPKSFYYSSPAQLAHALEVLKNSRELTDETLRILEVQVERGLED